MKYKYIMQDINTDETIEVYENTDRKAFRKAFRILDKRRLMDREIKIISKELLYSK